MMRWSTRKSLAPSRLSAPRPKAGRKIRRCAPATPARVPGRVHMRRCRQAPPRVAASLASPGRRSNSHPRRRASQAVSDLHRLEQAAPRAMPVTPLNPGRAGMHRPQQHRPCKLDTRKRSLHGGCESWQCCHGWRGANHQSQNLAPKFSLKRVRGRLASLAQSAHARV